MIIEPKPTPADQGRDRRQHARSMMTRPCKVFHRASRRFLPALSCNLSDGGALLEIDSPRALEPGDEIALGIQWTRSSVLAEESMILARVVRALDPVYGRRRVAVAFAREADLRLAA